MDLCSLFPEALPGRFCEEDDLVDVVVDALKPREESILGGMATITRTCDVPALVHALVEWISRDPFRAVSKKRNSVGEVVRGWPDRLREYRWQGKDYRETRDHLKPLFEEGRLLAEKIEHSDGWSDVEGECAVRLANDVFKWGGGGPRGGATPEAVRKVFLNALSGGVVVEKAPMSSGWSKVAAFATAHLEEEGERQPQAIWDSRVSTAVASRLDQMVTIAGATEVPRELQSIAIMKSRPGTGSRPRELELDEWGYTTGTWEYQLEGSSIICMMRDILNNVPRPNSDEKYPQMPLPDGTTVAWTIRGVEMILFMDGY